MSNLQIGAKIGVYNSYQLRYDCICMYTPSIRITLWFAMVTMHFHKAQMCLYFGTFFRVQGVPGNNLAPMKNCPGVQGRSNLIPGVHDCHLQKSIRLFFKIEINLILES